ncbi:hypothetical protein [Microbulbifer spongiae]|uniref:DUF2157 domain-containing protein n=1 Tax=Microbulbifer spongiae TaxID=2944933 RepID=A0ABY9EBZ2_9GAMM|nr:hypothetical protein [Microbulbifer sp. MI-G]WKD50533.1 hypothetical protein M8T91_03630 [Microbulbifer sp. MI-G]
MKCLLRLYPPAWQRRYGRELAEYLKAEPVSLHTLWDLLTGALDAWLHPGSIPVARESLEINKGEITMINHAKDNTIALTKADALRAAGLMIGITLVLTAVGVFLDKTFGSHPLINVLLHTSSIFALLVSGCYLLFKRHPLPVRPLAILGFVAIFYSLFLTAIIVAVKT